MRIYYTSFLIVFLLLAAEKLIAQLAVYPLSKYEFAVRSYQGRSVTVTYNGEKSRTTTELRRRTWFPLEWFNPYFKKWNKIVSVPSIITSKKKKYFLDERIFISGDSQSFFITLESYFQKWLANSELPAPFNDIDNFIKYVMYDDRDRNREKIAKMVLNGIALEELYHIFDYYANLKPSGTIIKDAIIDKKQARAYRSILPAFEINVDFQSSISDSLTDSHQNQFIKIGNINFTTSIPCSPEILISKSKLLTVRFHTSLGINRRRIVLGNLPGKPLFLHNSFVGNSQEDVEWLELIDTTTINLYRDNLIVALRTAVALGARHSLVLEYGWERGINEPKFGLVDLNSSEGVVNTSEESFENGISVATYYEDLTNYWKIRFTFHLNTRSYPFEKRYAPIWQRRSRRGFTLSFDIKSIVVPKVTINQNVITQGSNNSIYNPITVRERALQLGVSLGWSF